MKLNIAKSKREKTQIHFLSNVLAAVASSERPYLQKTVVRFIITDRGLLARESKINIHLSWSFL